MEGTCAPQHGTVPPLLRCSHCKESGSAKQVTCESKQGHYKRAAGGQNDKIGCSMHAELLSRKGTHGHEAKVFLVRYRTMQQVITLSP